MIEEDNKKLDLEFSVISRFCIYGFLKNQRYFEPFILLAFLEKGLSFFQIGLLVGFRSLTVNLFEIPSGAIADLYGRVRTLIFSFIAYTISFIVFALSDQLWHFFAAMFLFGIGEAFRTGTHKAIIFDYLKSRNQKDQKVRIYGLTRSFSQLGSAMSAFIAALLVFWRGNFSDIFWLCAIPSGINIVNFMGYPKSMITRPTYTIRLADVYRHVYKAFRDVVVDSRQRRLILESCGFGGTIKIIKDYNQIVIKQAALALPILSVMTDEKRTAILIGVVYTILYILASVSARHSWLVSKYFGSDERAAKFIWIAAVSIYALMVLAVYINMEYMIISTFVCILLLQNIWKPILIGRINSCCPDEQAATTLSIESQSKSFIAMILAPLLGLSVDYIGFIAVAVFGLIVSFAFLFSSKQ